MTDNRHEQPDDTSIADAINELDRETRTAEYGGRSAKLISFIAICFSLFQLYTGLFGVLDAQLQRAVHLAFGLALVYLLYPLRPQHRLRFSIHPVDAVLALLAAVPPVYLITNYHDLVLRAGDFTATDLGIGLLGVLLVIEAARRVVGIPMVTVVGIFLAYAFLGPYIPGILGHRGVTWEQLVSHLFYTTEGIFGIPLGVSSTFIFLFILFGAYLESTGLGHFFIDLANAVAGWARGGPAKVAVLASGLMGTVSGSSVANVAGTGSFTIPMMKKLGYNREFAGAVEAASSTGGQLMPPIMGAAAFLMAEFVNVPYMEIVKAATIPALLYFLGIWLGTHFEARRENLQGLPRKQLPETAKVFRERGHLAVPLVIIIYLLVSGYTPMRAALMGIFLTVAAAMLRPNTRLTPHQILQGLIDGARNMLSVLTACAAAGIIIGIVTQTGVGLKMASALLDLSGGNFLAVLFFTMLTSLVLGMGVPTTANYVITSTIAAPALIMLDVPRLAAHMFVFYFGIIADVTPPVALAAYAGAAISGGNALKTGVQASKLAIAAFLIPYMFVASPVLLMLDATAGAVLLALATAVIGMVAISSALIGYLLVKEAPWERILFALSGICLVDAGRLTDLVGLGVLALLFLNQYRLWRREQKQSA